MMCDFLQRFLLIFCLQIINKQLITLQVYCFSIMPAEKQKLVNMQMFARLFSF